MTADPGLIEPLNGDLTTRLLIASIVALALFLGVGAWRSLKRYQKGEMRAAMTWLVLILGLGGPATAAMVFAVDSETMKKPEFCVSCHAMEPFYADLHDTKSDALAAQHFQNNWVPKTPCYSCHTDYGAFGGVKAKWGGLHHAYVYYLTRRTDPPKLYQPYKNANCLRCHGGGENRRYAKESLHQENEAAILSGETSCLECHTTIHNLEGNHGGQKTK